jgi:hypothetical protein
MDHRKIIHLTLYLDRITINIRIFLKMQFTISSFTLIEANILNNDQKMNEDSPKKEKRQVYLR